MKLKKYSVFLPLAIAVLLGPLFIFPRDEWNWILLAGVCAIWIWLRIIREKILPKTPLDAAIALLCLMAFIGIFFMKDIGSGMGKIAGLIYGVLVFYLSVQALKSPGRMKVVIVVFLLAGVGFSVIGTVDRAVGSGASVPQIESRLVEAPKMKFNLKGAETGINPNPLGGMLVLFIPLAIMQLPLLSNKRFEYVPLLMRKIGLLGTILILGIFCVAVMLTSSFGTWFALALGLWLLGEKKRPLKIIIAGFVMLFVVYGFIKIGQHVKEGDTSTVSTISASIKSRVDMWKVGLEAVKERPITGIGMDQLRRRPDFLYENSHAHNQFLHTAAELGIPGLIAYTALLIGVFWMTREVRLSALPDWMRLTSRGLGTGIFAFTVFGLGDAIPLGAKPAVFFWISLAMITSILLYGRDKGLLEKHA